MTANAPSRENSTAAAVRAPSGMQFSGLDGVRGLAVLAVILFHCHSSFRPVATILTPILSAGWAGVDLFFVLSGFLITGILLDALGDGPTPPSGYYRSFYVRRALRIFPLYYAYLAAVLMASRFDLTSVIAWHLFYTQNILIARHGWGAVVALLGHLWSLAVEEQFYLVWPLLIATARRHRVPYLCMAAIVAAIGTRAYFVLHADRAAAYVISLSRADALAIGGLVAWAYRTPTVLPVLLRWRWFALAGAVLVLGIVNRTFAFAPSMQTWGYTAIAIVAAVLILSVVVAPPGAALSRAVTARWLRSAGKYSYGMYVLTPVVILAVRRAGGIRSEVPAPAAPLWQFGLFTLAVGAATYGAAWCSWQCYERHWLKFKARFEMPRAAKVREGTTRLTLP